MTKLENTHSTWTYFASISQYLIEKQENYSSLMTSEEEHFKLDSGLRMLIILGQASSIEGFFRQFLSTQKATIKEGRMSLLILRFRTFFCTRNRKVEKPLEEQSWNELKGSFEKITGIRLSTILKKKDKKLHIHLDGLFAFRNFFAHSKFMEIKAEKEVYAKQLTKYMESHDLNESAHWNIDNIISKKVVSHFQKIHLNVIEINYKKHVGIKSLVDNFAEKDDFETMEYKSLFWYKED